MDDSDDEPFEIPETIEIPIESDLDLHPFAPRETAAVVREWIDQVRGRYEVVTIIHGKGAGVQRKIVRDVLDSIPGVRGYEDSVRGNWGATVVHLAPRDGPA